MDNRALIFINLMNGVPVQQVMRDLNVQTEAEVMSAFSFVLRKVKSYCFLRKLPPVIATTVAEAQRYKVTCLTIVPKLKLDRDPEFRDIITETVTADNAEAIVREIRA